MMGTEDHSIKESEDIFLVLQDGAKAVDLYSVHKDRIGGMIAWALDFLWEQCAGAGNKIGWRFGDPREFFDKHGNIVISGDGKTFGGIVEANHSYYVELDREVLGGEDRDPAWIGPDHKWPLHWVWTVSPLPWRKEVEADTIKQARVRVYETSEEATAAIAQSKRIQESIPKSSQVELNADEKSYRLTPCECVAMVERHYHITPEDVVPFEVFVEEMKRYVSDEVPTVEMRKDFRLPFRGLDPPNTKRPQFTREFMCEPPGPSPAALLKKDLRHLSVEQRGEVFTDIMKGYHHCGGELDGGDYCPRCHER